MKLMEVTVVNNNVIINQLPKVLFGITHDFAAVIGKVRPKSHC